MPGLRFSQSTDMAIHGLLALAHMHEHRYLLLGDIARAQNLSESYLSKVFQRLSHAGLIRAVRGKHGGYALMRGLEEITVGDVVRAMETEQPMYQCLAQERCCETNGDCLLLGVFAEAERQMFAVLDGVRLAELKAEFLRHVERMAWLQPASAKSEAPSPSAKP
jgi:Rrf2 family protein